MEVSITKMDVISNDTLKSLIAVELVTILDVREHYEYQKGHIPGSLWIPFSCLTDCAGFFAIDTPLIIICNTENRSAAACRFLESEGFTELAYAIPGMKYWDGELEVEQCPPLERGTSDKKGVYLDYAATTPVDPKVASAVWWWLAKEFGNPSSVHLHGRKGKEAISKSRQQVACIIGSRDDEIIFTSGGTEADNTALWGVLRASGRKRLITSAIEHSAILENIKPLKDAGFQVTVLPVDTYGMVSATELASALSNDVGLVSIMFANNEVGTIQPVQQLAELTHRFGAYFHTDAVQGVGVCPINVDELQIDVLSLSGHKFYGPKGVGALYLRQGTPFSPCLVGGGQESQKRAGTENVSGIVGLGVACHLAHQRLGEAQGIKRLRDYLEEGLKSMCDVIIYGHPTQRLPGNLCISIPNYSGHQAVLDLDLAGISCSSGSACHGGKPSHVLQAMGVSETKAKTAIRFSLGRKTTETEIESVVEELGRLFRKYIY